MSDAEFMEYMLGHGDREWKRLHRQHLLWRDTLLGSLAPLGIGPGSRVLEVGCGSGVLLRDLAVVVGPEGAAVGLERDLSAVETARKSVADQEWSEVRAGDLFELTEPASEEEAFDLVVARWVLAWMPHPERAVERLASQLRPGGRILVQDYNYDAIRVEPAQAGLNRLFELMPKAYAHYGGDAWCAAHMPQCFAAAGLELEAVQPHCKAGDPESDVFRWAERFFREHVHKLVEDDLLSPDERDDSLKAWDRARETPGTVFFSPLVVNVIGRKPA